jgi:hypothetical protein
VWHRVAADVRSRHGSRSNSSVSGIRAHSCLHSRLHLGCNQAQCMGQQLCWVVLQSWVTATGV